MKKFRHLAFVFLLLFSVSFKMYAVSISFQLVQRGSERSDVLDASYIIEDSMFSYFFERGIVISNSPIVVSPSEKKDGSLFSKSMAEATEGGSDYFAELTVAYSLEDSTNPDAALLDNIASVSWRLFDVGTGKVLGSGVLKPNMDGLQKSAQQGIGEFIFLIAEDIYKIIRR